MTNAQDALDAALLVQAAMDTAAESALEHYTHEQDQTAALIILRDAASGTHATLAADEGGLQGLYDSALADSTPRVAATAAYLVTKTDAAALKT